VRLTFLEAPCEALLGVLSPARCAACDAPTPRDFCAACDLASSPLVDRLDDFAVVAVAPYDSGVGRAVARMKYGSRPDLARPLARRLGTALRNAPWCDAAQNAHVNGATAWSKALVVPVPLHPAKLAERGYNQSALLAAHLSTALGGAFRPHALARTRATRPQASLSREERLGNLHGAIVVREALAGESVVLVDDVVTTGTTALACAHALRKAGVAKVTIAAVARAVAEREAADAGSTG
jgi:ComF family protein